MEPGCISNGITRYDTDSDARCNTGRNAHIDSDSYSDTYSEYVNGGEWK